MSGFSSVVRGKFITFWYTCYGFTLSLIDQNLSFTTQQLTFLKSCDPLKVLLNYYFHHCNIIFVVCYQIWGCSVVSIIILALLEWLLIVVKYLAVALLHTFRAGSIDILWYTCNGFTLSLIDQNLSFTTLQLIFLK